MQLVEGIIGRRSVLIGSSPAEIRKGRPGFHGVFGVHILALHRHGEPLPDFDSEPLRFGDTLLMEGEEENLGQLRENWDFVTLDVPPAPDLRPEKMPIALVVLGAFVVGAGFQVLPIPGLALMAAVAMLLTGCIRAQEAYEAVEWNILTLIFGMLALGLAMEQTGAAHLLVQGIMDVFGPHAPVLVLAALYLLSSALTELITNNAVAALLTPLALGMAATLGVDARPFLVAIMFGCSASFATPIGYQTNTYVYGAGGYRFIDFPRVGLPLNLILWLVATALIPVMWPF